MNHNFNTEVQGIKGAKMAWGFFQADLCPFDPLNLDVFNRLKFQEAINEYGQCCL
jgi:hypothetical protein